MATTHVQSWRCRLPRKQVLNRRRFLQGTGLSLAAWALGRPSARAIEPFARAGAPRLLLSLAAYSFREFFNHSDPAKRMDLFQFIDFCAAHGCQGTELTSYYFPKELSEDYLLKVRRHAFLRGVAVSGTAVGNEFTLPKGEKRDAQIASVKQWIDHAATLGAPHVRIFAGQVHGTTKEEAKKLCISAVEECADYAGRKGIFLGLENHSGIATDPAELVDMVRAIQSPWVGLNLDTGNFVTDDPYRDVALCAPYAVNVQMKAEIKRRGQKSEPADLPRKVKILREANYQGYVALEYEAAEDPWQAVPGLLKRMKELFAV
jgi:sugar phosphate isomerase/epimerase